MAQHCGTTPSDIFCEDCEHFEQGDRIPFSYGPPEYLREKCYAPENFKDTHKTPNSLPISSPKVINRFNDCVWFDPIEEESGSSSTSSSSSTIIDMP
jgi:hypothetical protein